MQLIESFSALVWGFPIILLLLSTHLFMTIRCKGVQFRFIRQFQSIFVHHPHDNGEISQFSALMTILASTLGTGNVLGVSTALIAGGAGSIFWMIAAGFLGMATKYAETWLAVEHREIQRDGTLLGGAMVLLKEKHPVLSILFALFTPLAALGIGCSVQANAASLMLKNTFDLPVICSAVLFSVLSALVILKGLKGIAALCNVLIPAASLLYLGACILLLMMNRNFLMPSLELIISSAFSPKSAAAGFLGASVSNAIRYGISRGMFTNESGMGSTPILSASSSCSDSETPSYAAMLSVFLDTVVVCSITGLVFVSCILRYPALTFMQDADQLSLSCFSLIPLFGKQILCLSLVLFGCSTIFGWCVVGERSLQFLFGKKAVLPYRILWIVFVFLGCISNLDTLWAFSDLFNALMCIPNLIAIYLYADEIKT